MGAHAVCNAATEAKASADLRRKHGTVHGSLELDKRHIRPYIGDTTVDEVTLDDLQAMQSLLAPPYRYRAAWHQLVIRGQFNFFGG